MLFSEFVSTRIDTSAARGHRATALESERYLLTSLSRLHRLSAMFPQFGLEARTLPWATALLVVAVLQAAPVFPQNRASTRANVRPSSTDAELTRLRRDVLDKMKESHAGAQKLLAIHEEEKKRLYDEYLERRELFHQGLISRTELLQSESALAIAITRVDEDKRWLAESEIAMTEASSRDIILGLPVLGAGGYMDSKSLIRFNGATFWSLADAFKVESYFSKTFGRTLPISAYGQTATHDRLRFDHRNAIDVALHPDSVEGQSLLAYLRRAGIPFIAFRNAVAGAATGAHIHIGQPSPQKH